MRLILIFAALLGIIGFGAWKVSTVFDQSKKTESDSGGVFSSPDSPAPVGSSPRPASEIERLKSQLGEEERKRALALNELQKVSQDKTAEIEKQKIEAEQKKKEIEKLEADLAKKQAVHLQSLPFLNRPVPDLSALSSGENVNPDSFNIIVDKTSNAWIVQGNDEFIESMRSFVERLDVKSQILDLDFLLVAVRESKLREMGLQGLMREGANFLDSVDLEFDKFGLSLGLSDVRLDFNFGRKNDDVSVVSLPVVRAFTGVPFVFKNVEEVPVSTVSRQDGIETTSYDFKEVGLMFSGEVNVVGQKLHLALNGENGSFAQSRLPDALIPPIFRKSSFQTQSFVTWNSWTVMAGMIVERSSVVRGLLSKKKESSRDLLLVFVRPRFQLKPIPRAIPVGFDAVDDPQKHPLTNRDSLDLLPTKIQIQK